MYGSVPTWHVLFLHIQGSVPSCYDLFRGGGLVMLGSYRIPRGELVLAVNVVVIEAWNVMSNKVGNVPLMLS